MEAPLKFPQRFHSSADSLLQILVPNGFVIALHAAARSIQNIPGLQLAATAGPAIVFQRYEEAASHGEVTSPSSPNVPGSLKAPSRLLSTVLVEADDAGPTSKALAYSIMKDLGRPVAMLSLSMIENFAFPQGSIIVSLLEAEKPLLRSINERQMYFVRNMTDKASKLVWVTAGDLLGAAQPDYSLAAGISRSLMAEQPNLDFFTLDVPANEVDSQRTADNIAAILNQQDDLAKDLEFIQQNGVLHVSRFTENTNANVQFGEDQTKLAQLVSFDSGGGEAPVRVTLEPSKTYIVVGGTGGIGSSLTEWILSRGARKVLLLSQSGRSNGYLRWRASSYEAILTVEQCDITRPRDVERAISQVAGEIGGVIHSAMSLCVCPEQYSP